MWLCRMVNSSECDASLPSVEASGAFPASFVKISCSYRSCKYIKQRIFKYTLLTTWVVLCSSTSTRQTELYLHLGRFFTQLSSSSLASGPSGCMTSTVPPSFPLPSWVMNTPPHAALQIWLYSWSRPRWNSAELLSLAGTGTVPCHCGPATATIKGENGVGGGTGGWDGQGGHRWREVVWRNLFIPPHQNI